MTTILHISDTHAQSEVNARIEKLARTETNVDVIALTGDCTSLTERAVPDSWNLWPQKVKLSVPGNHLDSSDTYSMLSEWTHQAPWFLRLDDLLFIGLDTSQSSSDADRQFSRLNIVRKVSDQAIVLLSHQWPEEPGARRLGEDLKQQFGNLTILVLYGHHHRDFSGSLWDPDSKLGPIGCVRSQVCSSVSKQRGLAHRITWNFPRFEYELIQGPHSRDGRR